MDITASIGFAYAPQNDYMIIANKLWNHLLHYPKFIGKVIATDIRNISGAAARIQILAGVIAVHLIIGGQTMTDMNKESWMKRNRVKVQVAALVVGLSCPFLLYAALNAHLPALAGLVFAVLLVSMGAVIWQG